jgi:hypothetical protein
MMTSVQTTPMTATLNTSEVRLALISWRSELLTLGSEFPDFFSAPAITDRIAALDAALLAIDTSKTVALMPDA